jgi:hypothetical protein
MSIGLTFQQYSMRVPLFESRSKRAAPKRNRSVKRDAEICVSPASIGSLSRLDFGPVELQCRWCGLLNRFNPCLQPFHRGLNIFPKQGDRRGGSSGQPALTAVEVGVMSVAVCELNRQPCEALCVQGTRCWAIDEGAIALQVRSVSLRSTHLPDFEEPARDEAMAIHHGLQNPDNFNPIIDWDGEDQILAETAQCKLKMERKGNANLLQPLLE